MKNKKIIILCIPIIVVVLILVGFTMVFSKENIQKNVDGVKFDKKWNRIMAREINKNKINLKVDGRTIECNGETPYMTNKMGLSSPQETNVVENDSAIRATVQKFKIFILNIDR